MRKRELFLLTICFLTLQSINAQISEHFFIKNDKLVSRKIVELFNAGNELYQLSYYSGDRIFKKEYGKSVPTDSSHVTFILGCDNTNLSVGLKFAWKPVHFYSMSISGSGLTPPSAETMKNFAAYISKKYTKGDIAWIEKKIGKSLNKMDAKELCRAFLTLHYWKTGQ